MKKLFLSGVAACVYILSAMLPGMAQNVSPFGVCMHLDGGESRQMPENIRMARDAGIRWIRADFSWGSVESPQGNWHYDRLDRVVRETEQLNMNLLALLMGRPSWGRPVYEHLDEWLLYVENVVTRYKDKVRCWEIWNETNLAPRFWDKLDDPENYAMVLKATYKKIKEIDPNLVVVYAGTAGIPMNYIERSFQAGAGEGFDKMAVHPYRPLMDTWETTLFYKKNIDDLRALMTKYKIDKEIWLTEMGMSTMVTVVNKNRNVFHDAKAETGKDWKVAVVCDDDFPVAADYTAENLRALFPAGFRLDTLTIFRMMRTRLSDYDAVFFPPAENIPLHISQTLTPSLTGYIRGGGKVYYDTSSGNIFYYGDGASKETDQANYIAQTMWLSLRFGVEKYFLYEFESSDGNIFDREANFGLTRRGLNPKPAYNAYSAMSKLFPDGSKIDASIEWRQKDCCVVGWKQPDGTRVWAVWSPEGARKAKVKIGKGLRQTLNCMGGAIPEVTEASGTLDVGAGVVYLVGPESLEIQ